MDLITEYQNFENTIDSCDNEESIKSYQNANTFTAMQKEFWRQRQLYFKASDSLEKQKVKAKLRWIQNFFGCSIPLKRSIPKFTAPNGFNGIIIAPEVSMGKNCVIFQQVYIGTDTLADSNNAGIPLIGNNVYIGAGTKIIGNVLVGDNVRIDPNCFITTDIPANSHVTNCGAQIVQQNVNLDNTHVSTQNFLNQCFSSCEYNFDDNTNDSSLTVSKAAIHELDEIIQIYKNRINWFKWKKLSQWNNYLINHPKEEFSESIKKGEYYVIKKDSIIVGGFVLTTDPYCWSETTSDALYLRRAVSKTGCKNLGKYITSQAIKLTKDLGKNILRLECVSSNAALNEVWESLGFTFVSEIEHDYIFTLRELKL